MGSVTGETAESRPWRIAAQTALNDLNFSPAERQRNHDYYLREARRIEGEAPDGQQIATGTAT